MKIGNDERLSILKQYARKRFGLTRNVRVLVLLISEKEREELSRAIQARKEYWLSKGRRITEIPPPEFSVHASHEFFPREEPALTFRLRKKGIKTESINALWKGKIPKFRKYEYAIIMRVEKLEGYGRKRLTNDSDIPNLAQHGFCRLLAHEFLHVVEEETGIPLFKDNERDEILVEIVLSELPQSYWTMLNYKEQ